MVTITDIAAALGITPSTVSRALAGSPRVKEETRLAVERTAAEMGYEPNAFASTLRQGRSRIVGVVVPRIHREFFSNLIGGAESVLNEAGYSVLICQTLERFDAEVKALRTLKMYRVAGVLLSHAISAGDGGHVRSILGDIPLVQFDRVFPELPGAKIVGANFDGAYSATRHLVEAGYRKIGTLAGFMTSRAYVDRLEGYRKAIEDAGRQYDPDLVFPECMVEETGYAGALQALEEGCDALYCCGDFCALGAVRALQEKGIRIPEDFGIVGTANESFTSLMTPSLSSIGQHPFEMGQAAARAFLSGSVDTEVIPMELIIRQSSNHYNQWQK